jgi:hypothetical protein
MEEEEGKGVLYIPLESGSRRDPCGDPRTLLYLDCGGGYPKLPK